MNILIGLVLIIMLLCAIPRPPGWPVVTFAAVVFLLIYIVVTVVLTYSVITGVL